MILINRGYHLNIMQCM